MKFDRIAVGRGPSAPFPLVLAILLVSVLLDGCGPATTVGVAAPGSAPAGSRAGVRFYWHPHVPGQVEMPHVSFTFADRGQARTVRSTEFSTEQLGTPYSAYFETAPRDSLRVTAVLHAAGGDTLAVGGLVLPLRPDWHWGVSAAVNRRSTVLREPGLDPERFRDHWTIRGQESEPDPLVLYLRYAGRSISRPTPH